MAGRARKSRANKAGLPAGALVHIGEVKTQSPRVQCIDFDGERCTEREAGDLASLDALLASSTEGGVRWLNIYGLQDPALLSAIGSRFGLHPLVLEDILNTDQRPKLDEYGDYLFIVAHVYTGLRGGRLESDQISIVLGRGFVLTFQERPTGTFEPVRARLRTPRTPVRSHGADYLMYSLLDTLVDRQFVLVEHLSDEAERLEDVILGKAARTRTLYAIHELKRQLTEVRRKVWPLRELVHVLQRNPGGLLAAETVLYLRDIYDHTVHVIDSLEALRELLASTLDIYLTTVSNRVNREVRMLTVIATIFMPAALVAGIFGMNFEQMPLLDAPHGFAFAIGLMAGIAVVMLALFWRRKML